MNKPYVGVTGITNEQELDDVLAVFEESHFTPQGHHTGMVGFLAGRETAKDKEPQSPRHVADRAALAQLSERTGGRAMPVVHYETGGEQAFSQHLIDTVRDVYSDRTCRTVQINGTPSPEEVTELLRNLDGLQLIYQVRPRLMEKGPNAVVEEIAKHRGAFQYVLIDPSCGTGRNMETVEAVQLHDALKRAFAPAVMIGFAGGFNRSNAETRVHDLTISLSNHNFSVDAEKGLRSPVDDRLSIPHVQGYVRGVAKGFRTAR